MLRMPAKYPVDRSSFAEIIEGKFLYVDKTDLVYELVTGIKYCFLSRPRRFGKSLLTSTLESYFKGRRNLFVGLKIDALETDWEMHPVFRFDLSAENYDSVEKVRGKIDYYLSRWEREYGCDCKGSISVRFMSLIEKAFLQSGKKVVVLIDEYDKPLLDTLDKSELHDTVREELRGFYSVLKASDEFVRFVFLTGVTKFNKVSIFSGLNNLRDISLSPAYNAICGITQKEMYEYFRESVDVLAANTGNSVQKIWDDLKTRYDGYHFAESGEDIYNPISVLYAFAEQRLRNYWFATATPGFLIRLITTYHFELSEFDGAQRSADQLSDLSNLTTDIVPLLYQTGYLTIKGYDETTERYTLGYPNTEVSKSLWNSLAGYFFPKNVRNGVFDTLKFINDVNHGDVESFMVRLKSLFASATSETEPDKEVHFQNMMAIVVWMLGYEARTEIHSAGGRCDMILMTSDYIYIFEFKIDGSAKNAISQIKEKGYMHPYMIDPRKKVLIGAVFSTVTRTLDSWIIENID